MEGGISFKIRHSQCFSRRQPWIIGLRAVVAGNEKAVRFAALDLRSGRWPALPAVPNSEPIFYNSKPWALFAAVAGDAKQQQGNATVIDLQTGTTLFRWNSRRTSSQRIMPQLPVFLGENLIAVPTTSRPASGEVVGANDHRLEMWSIPPDENPVREFPGVQMGFGAVASSTGRIAWLQLGVDEKVEVFGVNEARTRFRKSTNWRSPPRRSESPVLSTDGRAVYVDPPGICWNVDDGRELWSNRRTVGDSLLQRIDQVYSVESDGRYTVEESWRLRLWLCFDGETWAVRRMHDGGLIERTWTTPLAPTEIASTDRTLICDDHEVVGSIPPRANWPLLALCQTILALPLVLLWTVLRWRQKRRMRLASVVP